MGVSKVYAKQVVYESIPHRGQNRRDLRKIQMISSDEIELGSKW